MTLFLCETGLVILLGFCEIGFWLPLISQVFDALSQAVCSIACSKNGVEIMFHLLDDFLAVDKPDICTGERTRAALSLIFNRLQIPLAAHKCVGPWHYLGQYANGCNIAQGQGGAHHSVH